VPEYKRSYDRIEVDLPCRLYIPEEGKKGGLKFEAYTASRNLSLGGVFVESTFLLKPQVELWIELGLPDGPLAVRGRVVHTIPLEHSQYPSGMGVEFLGVDSKGRETLLRYFTPSLYQEFYEAILSEFKHLERKFEMPDVSLMLNLWEEWKIKREGGPASTASGAPELPTKRSAKRH
jgi:hypothetical protein